MRGNKEDLPIGVPGIVTPTPEDGINKELTMLGDQLEQLPLDDHQARGAVIQRRTELWIQRDGRDSVPTGAVPGENPYQPREEPGRTVFSDDETPLDEI